MLAEFGGELPLASLRRQLAEGRIGRREFLRYAVLVGLAVPEALAEIGAAGTARAALPQGGTLRLGTRVKDIKNPHTYSWGAYDSNVCRQVCEYLTLTDHDNVTHPWLLERWQVSDDLQTWTLALRPGVKWHNGEDFTADQVIWNLRRLTDPAVGSSFLGLVKGYLMREVPDGTGADGKPRTRLVLWDAQAIERVDAHTVRLHCHSPQVAVPEHLFHYPALMLYPGDNGVFGPGAQGTGAFTLTDFEAGKLARVRAVKNYWGEGPQLEAIEFIDLGDDVSAGISALASRQVHGLVDTDPMQYPALHQIPFLQFYQVSTAETAVLRVKLDAKPFDDARVRQAMRLGLDNTEIMQVALRGLGTAGQNVHVAPVQPDYGRVPAVRRDVAQAKQLLADAGYPTGFETTLYLPASPGWLAAACQAAVEQWQEIGLRVKLSVMPGAAYWDVWTKVPFGCTLWYHRPLGVMVLGLAYRAGVPWNETGYANPAFDRLLAEAEGTLDAARRSAVMAELEAMLQADGPMVQPLWRTLFTFMDHAVQGFTMHPSQYVFGNQLALLAG